MLVVIDIVIVVVVVVVYEHGHDDVVARSHCLSFAFELIRRRQKSSFDISNFIRINNNNDDDDGNQRERNSPCGYRRSRLCSPSSQTPHSRCRSGTAHHAALRPLHHLVSCFTFVYACPSNNKKTADSLLFSRSGSFVQFMSFAFAHPPRRSGRVFVPPPSQGPLNGFGYAIKPNIWVSARFVLRFVSLQCRRASDRFSISRTGEGGCSARNREKRKERTLGEIISRRRPSLPV